MVPARRVGVLHEKAALLGYDRTGIGGASVWGMHAAKTFEIVWFDYRSLADIAGSTDGVRYDSRAAAVEAAEAINGTVFLFAQPSRGWEVMSSESAAARRAAQVAA